jgi:hypothetical protein
MNKTFAILISSLVLSVSAFSQPRLIKQDGVAVDITLKPTTFLVGEPITLEINATTYGDKELSLDDLALGPFTVTDQYNLLDIPTEEGRSWHWSMQLDTFDATVTSLSGVVINWVDTQGNDGIIELDPISVNISSVAHEDVTLRDLKNAVPLFTSSKWPIALWVVLAAVGLYFLRKLLRKKPVSLSANEQAMRALHRLRNANLEPLAFYTELSDIVRRYLEGRFNIAATGQTTREFLIASKQSSHLEQSDRQSLTTFLVAADLVKFARFEPSVDTCNDAITEAKQFITATIPSAEEPLVEVAA